jgi:signal transduction histidine kinase
MGFTEETEGLQISFKEKDLESYFRRKDLEKELKNLRISSIFLCLPLLIYTSLSIYHNRTLIKTGYLFILGIIVEILLSNISCFIKNNYSSFKILKFFRFFLVYANLSFNLIFPVSLTSDNILRYTYIFTIYFNFLYRYFIDFNYILIAMIPILNCLVLLISQLNQTSVQITLLPEIAVNIILYSASFYIKKCEFLREKHLFYEDYTNNFYNEYIRNLVNAINTIIISVKKKDILYINNYGVKILKKLNDKSKSSKNMCEIVEEEKTILNEINTEMKKHLNYFFKNLILISSFDPKFEEGNDLIQIIDNIFSQQSHFSINFLKIGYFSCSIFGENYYELHIRIFSYREKALEILIHDITDIKIAEKNNIETKYKKKILAKIAHEFKTPLITIISLINKTVDTQNNDLFDESTKRNLNYINSLSNYTLVLITDIIQYVSEYVNMKITNNEFNPKEVLDFCNNILKTLIECNENKSGNIITYTEIDESLDDILISTDETRLKQVILNFISNAYKFTFDGFIKLKAKVINESDLLEISVEDTGVGIKQEDQFQIFKENPQISINKEYNSQGSGLGLSITNNLAKLMDYQIGFTSTFGKGSIFYLRMKFIKKYSQLGLGINLDHSCETSHKDLDKYKIEDLEERKFRTVSSENEFDEIGNEIDILITEKRNFDFEKCITNDNFNYSNFLLWNENFSILPSKIQYLIPSIIIVDDHKLVRENTINIIRSILISTKSFSYQIIECSDGIELLNIVKNDKKNKVKLILIDENMEYLNGSDTVKILRNLEDDKKINSYNIISITSFDDKETKSKILKSGLNEVITKPCTKSELKTIFKKYLGVIDF